MLFRSRPISAAVLERIARDAGVEPAPRLSEQAYEHLSRYAFPGNVRELENLLQRAVAMSGGDVIGRDDLGLPDAAFGDTQYADDLGALPPPEPPAAPADAPLPTDLAAYLDDVERDILARALERHRYNRTAAGASLGLSLRQMRYRMARLQVGVDAAGDGGVESDA